MYLKKKAKIKKRKKRENKKEKKAKKSCTFVLVIGTIYHIYFPIMLITFEILSSTYKKRNTGFIKAKRRPTTF